MEELNKLRSELDKLDFELIDLIASKIQIIESSKSSDNLDDLYLVLNEVLRKSYDDEKINTSISHKDEIIEIMHKINYLLLDEFGNSDV